MTQYVFSFSSLIFSVLGNGQMYGWGSEKHIGKISMLVSYLIPLMIGNYATYKNSVLITLQNVILEQ
jgi:hypothetical protein